jgi:hypothetical protein
LLRLLLIAAAAFAFGAEPAPLALTRVDHIRALSADAAARGLPVRLRGVVTFREASQFSFYFHDGTGGVFVNTGKRRLPFRAGDRVQVQGITAPGGFIPVVMEERTRKLGRAPYPQPRPAHYADLALGRAPSEWVQARAMVMAAERTNAAGV